MRLLDSSQRLWHELEGWRDAHFLGNVIQPGVDRALGFRRVLLEQDRADEFVDVCVVGEG